MKKWIAALLAVVVLASLASCGAKTPAPVETTEPETEMTTDPSVTEPEVGRVDEKETFYVYIPEKWCKMEYQGDDTRIRLFDIPSAPKIKDDTPEVEIKVSAGDAKQEDVDAAVALLLKKEGAKKGAAIKISGADFTTVTYTNQKEKRDYTVYTGLVDGKLASVTLKGIDPADENAVKIVGSLCVK